MADLEVQISRYHVAKNGQSLVMTKLEMRLLHCLCEHFPHLAPLDRLLTFGWEGTGEPDPSLIKTHISHIRRKLARAGGAPLQIVSKQGVGYMLVEG
ncbi:MAG: helix-turn-helix domain-containing protein [Dehalococcoidia bacterium]|nr:helix-turn-helix domain-containing protein [Dehalococcoidia bacterium]